ncbi:MAG: RraA family protein [Limisphaerales bacterium]
METPLSPEQLQALRSLSTCTVANAVETFETRLRNEGFLGSGIRAVFPQQKPVVGYAVTITIRCSSPPPVGHNYLEHTEWWDEFAKQPGPRIVVIEDVDPLSGLGAFVGEVHANILKALGCVGVVTNGAVRDLPALEALGFAVFASRIAVSHAYAHIVEIGTAVEIAGLKIEPGDLLHGDCHGVISIPTKIAAEVPAVAARMLAREKEVISLCKLDGNVEELRSAIRKFRSTPV